MAQMLKALLEDRSTVRRNELKTGDDGRRKTELKRRRFAKNTDDKTRN